jgi:ComF family protein
MKLGTRAFGGFLEMLFPGRCLVCGRWLLNQDWSGAQVCADCRRGLVPQGGPRCETCGTPLISEQTECLRCREAEFAFTSHRSVFAYDGAVRDLIACLKFEQRFRLSSFFADILGPRIQEAHPGVPIVPVPGRKFPDAVELIARELRARHGIEVLRLLQRSGGQAQKTLDLRERRQNLHGRIQSVPGQAPAELVLFDDVFTTGATADTCARALLRAGCRKVSVISIAMEE